MPVCKIITTVVSVILVLTSTVAPHPFVPSSDSSKPSTQRRDLGSNNFEWLSYTSSKAANAPHPFVHGAPTTPSEVSPDAEAAALSYVSKQIGIPKDSFKLRGTFVDPTGTTHAYIIQSLNGLPEANRVVNIGFDKSGKFIGFDSDIGSSNWEQYSDDTNSEQDTVIDAADFIPDTAEDEPAGWSDMPAYPDGGPH